MKNAMITLVTICKDAEKTIHRNTVHINTHDNIYQLTTARKISLKYEKIDDEQPEKKRRTRGGQERW